MMTSQVVAERTEYPEVEVHAVEIQKFGGADGVKGAGVFE